MLLSIILVRSIPAIRKKSGHSITGFFLLSFPVLKTLCSIAGRSDASHSIGMPAGMDRKNGRMRPGRSAGSDPMIKMVRNSLEDFYEFRMFSA
jgi:hypothetical protein